MSAESFRLRSASIRRLFAPAPMPSCLWHPTKRADVIPVEKVIQPTDQNVDGAEHLDDDKVELEFAERGAKIGTEIAATFPRAVVENK
jgi:hypothetical protein